MAITLEGVRRVEISAEALDAIRQESGKGGADGHASSHTDQESRQTPRQDRVPDFARVLEMIGRLEREQASAETITIVTSLQAGSQMWRQETAEVQSAQMQRHKMTVEEFIGALKEWSAGEEAEPPAWTLEEGLPLFGRAGARENPVRREADGLAARVVQSARAGAAGTLAAAGRELQSFAASASAKTADFLRLNGQPEAASLLRESVRRSVCDRARQLELLSRIGRDGRISPRAEGTSRAVKPAAYDWPRADSGWWPLPKLAAADVLVSQMRAYERHLMAAPVKNEELLGVELGMLALKAEVLGRQSEAWHEALAGAVAFYTRGLLDRLDRALAAQERSGPADERGFQPLERGAVYRVARDFVDSYRETQDVQRSVRRGVEDAERIFSQKKRDKVYGRIYRYKWAEDLWDNSYFVYRRERKRGAAALARREWNDYIRAAGLPDTLLLHRSLLESGALEALLPHSGSFGRGFGALLLVLWGGFLPAALFAPRLGFGSRAAPAGLLALLALSAVWLVLRRQRGAAGRVWGVLFLLDLAALLSVSAALFPAVP